MIPDEVRDYFLEALIADKRELLDLRDSPFVSEADIKRDLAKNQAARQWLDKPFAHRNGETEPPTEPGHYWFRGLNTRTDHRIRKWVLGEISKNMQFFYAHGWGSPEEFIGEWHGPIPEPQQENNAK